MNATFCSAGTRCACRRDEICAARARGTVILQPKTYTYYYMNKKPYIPPTACLMRLGAAAMIAASINFDEDRRHGNQDGLPEGDESTWHSNLIKRRNLWED